MDIIIGIVVGIMAAWLGYQLFWRKSTSTTDLTNEATAEASKEESLKLQRDNDSLKNRIRELTSQLEELPQENEAALRSRQEMEKEIERLSADLSRKGEEIESLNADLNKKEEKIEQLKGNLNSVEKEASLSGDELTQKLRKKLSQLEDENEDLEDDLDKAEKKAKELKRQLVENEEQLHAEKKAHKATQEKCQQAENDLEDSQQKVHSKDGALKFVQGILQAKTREATGNTAKIEQKIYELEGFVMEEFADSIKLIYDKKSAPDVCNYGTQLYYLWRAKRLKSWLYKKRAVAFVGEFSAGKTSIVNRLLSPDNLEEAKLPVSAKATTAIPTYIAGGPKENYGYVDQGGNIRSLEKTFFEKTDKSVLGELKGLGNLIKYYVMEYNNPQLNGFSILDTPGFDSNDPEDKTRTQEVINECDALFWVIDINAGELNQSSVNIIRESLGEVPLYVIINKIDTKPNVQEHKAVREKVRQTLENNGIGYCDILFFTEREPKYLQNLLDVIHQTPKSEASEEFLPWMRAEIKDCEEWLEERQKSLDQENAQCSKHFDDCRDLLDMFLLDLSMISEEAVDIPQYTEHIFSSNRYEMSIEEYKELEKRLEFIQKTCAEKGEISKSIDDALDALKCLSENEQLREQHKARFAQFKAMKKRFTELTKGLN
jgi:putative atp /gtp binding protein